MEATPPIVPAMQLGHYLRVPDYQHALEAHVAITVQRLRVLALTGCVCLIVYGSLFPFTGWQASVNIPAALAQVTPSDVPLADVLTNFLLYMPLGVLIALGRRRVPGVLAAAICGAAALSLTMEVLQLFLPGRVSSLLDLGLNTFGSGVGACGGLLARAHAARLMSWSGIHLYGDRAAWVGCAALLGWMAAQLIPFVPSLDVGNLRNGLKPLWYALLGRDPVSVWRTGVYLAAVAALTVTGTTVLNTRRAPWIAAAALLMVLPLKVLVVGRQVSPEAFLGTVAGVGMGLVLWAAGRRRAERAAMLLILVYLVVEALRPDAFENAMHSFNWVPFRQQLIQTVNGLSNLADAIWPLLALACLRLRAGARSLWLATPAVALLLMALEWAQLWVPGRYPDVTDVLIGTIAWMAAAVYAGRGPVEPAGFNPH